MILAKRPHTVGSYLISGAAAPAPRRPIPPIMPIPIGAGAGAAAASPPAAGSAAAASAAGASPASGIGAGLDASGLSAPLWADAASDGASALSAGSFFGRGFNGYSLDLRLSLSTRAASTAAPTRACGRRASFRFVVFEQRFALEVVQADRDFFLGCVTAIHVLICLLDTSTIIRSRSPLALQVLPPPPA